MAVTHKYAIDLHTRLRETMLQLRAEKPVCGRSATVE